MSRHVVDDMNSVPEICKRHNKSMYWYGDWYCSECQKEEEMYEQESLGRWFEKVALCLKCYNAEWMDEWGGDCYVYKMPLHMVARKKKCKHFEPFEEIFKDGYPIRIKKPTKEVRTDANN